MVLSMESISHGLRYMEKPSHHCSWGVWEGTLAGVALVSLPLLRMSRSGTSANLLLIEMRQVFVNLHHFLLFQHRSREKGAPQHTRRKGWLLADLFFACNSVYHISGVSSTDIIQFDIGPAGWQVRRIGTEREGRGGQAYSSILALLRQKDIISQQGPFWRTATNRVLGSNVPKCKGNLGFLVTEIFCV